MHILVYVHETDIFVVNGHRNMLITRYALNISRRNYDMEVVPDITISGDRILAHSFYIPLDLLP